MQPRFLIISLTLALLWVLVVGCGQGPPEPPQGILGRWEVVRSEGMSVPNTFFWVMMDELEFREDGEVWALIRWPPGTGSELRLNTTGAYALVGEDQIEFVGSCRHEDPCTGLYTLVQEGDTLQLFAGESKLELKWAGPPSEEPPPAIPGPSASPTPSAVP